MSVLMRCFIYIRRSGVIQDGDRLLAIDGIYLENKTMEEAKQMLRECKVKAILTIEFDVAESIVPSSGIFVVKLAKRGSSLGITISCKWYKYIRHLL